jgi:hypothetical protein
MKLMVLTKGRPPTPSRCFHLESRLNLFLILNLSIGNTILQRGVRIDSQEMLKVLW